MANMQGTSNGPMGAPGKRRIKILLSVIIALIVIVSGIWFVVAWKVEEFVDRAIEAHNEQDREFNCNDRGMTGFPFRISINCSSVAASFKEGTTSLTAGQLRTAAQIYQPGKVVGELDGPLTINTIDGDRIEGNWELARLSFKVKLDGELARLAAQFDKPRLSFLLPDQLEEQASLPLAFAASQAEFYSRQGEEPGSVDLAGRIQSMTLDFPPGTLVMEDGMNADTVKVPKVDTFLNVNLKDVASIVMRGGNLEDHIREYGLAGELRQIAIVPEKGGRLELSGPFDIDKEGRFSGKLELKFSQLPRLVAFVASIHPQLGKQLGGFAGMIEGLASKNKGTGDGGGDADQENKAEKDAPTHSLPIKVNKGKISIGIFPAGEIAPLFES